MHRPPHDRTTGVAGEIHPERLYTLAEFMLRVGIGKTGLRAARRRGLAVLYYGRQGYIRGRDWIEHVERCATTTR